jgi:LuxR family maltose regulon positive regulatory protein
MMSRSSSTASPPRAKRKAPRARAPRARVEPTRDFALLESKLAPPPERPGDVRRTGPVNRLRSARHAKLVLVTAPAGYGKTTLVADWARRDGRLFAWYGVDETDDESRFVAHMYAAISRALDTPEDAARVVPAHAHAGWTIALLARELELSASPIVVVLDGVERLRDPESVRLLARFVDELPQNAQLALVGRAEIPLPLARLRAHGELMELGLDDLRFSNREAAALLRNAGVELASRDVDRLNGELEGWPAALRLAAETLRAGGQEPRARIGVAALPEEYFRELLSRLPADEVRFLTRVSVLARLSGPVCDLAAETTGSAELLERLQRSNLFVVPLDREGHWYRLHPVFRRVLSAELERYESETAKAVLGRAASWCSTYGDIGLALEYACSAGDVEQFVELLESSPAPFGATSKPARVESLLQTLDDDELLELHPAVAVIGAVTWAISGRPDAAERWSEAATRGARLGENGAMDASPWQALLRALRYPSGPDEMLADAERALDGLPTRSAWRSAALLVMACANAQKGCGSAADSCAREAADVATSVGATALEAVAVAYRSLLAADRGNWPRSDALAEEARRRTAELCLDDDVTSLFALAASARAALRNGDWGRVRAETERAAVLLPQLTHALGSFAVFLRLEFARVHLALGDALGAERLLDEVDGVFARQPRLGVFVDDAARLRAELEDHRAAPDGEASSLTAAELRLLPYLTTHMSFREIADRLYVSRNTVKTQAISVYRKLGVCSRASAIARASKLGLVEDDV